MTRRGAELDEDTAEEAAAWFVRLNGETATGDDWTAFERWLQASPAHVRAYQRIERLWVDLDAQAAQLAAALSAPRRARPRWVWPAAGAALAASLTVAVVIGVTGRPPAPVIYQTAAGQVRQVALADGTVVRLNAASRLTVALGRRVRDVQMADGEAAFDVAHDPARPFVIHVGDSQVRVVGTEFDVRRRSGELRVTVRRGVVEVRSEPAAQPVRLTVGEQLTHRDGEAGARVSTIDADEAFGWTVGQLVYHDQPLSEVAADLSRRFGTQIRPADAATAQIRFTGVLVTDSEPAVLRRLEAFSGVTAEKAADGAVVLRRAGGRR